MRGFLVGALALALVSACSTDNTGGGGGAGSGTLDAGVLDSATANDSGSSNADTGGPTDSGGAGDATPQCGSVAADGGVCVDAGTGKVDAGPPPKDNYDLVHEKLVVQQKCNGGYCHSNGAGGLEMHDGKPDDAYKALLFGTSKGIFSDKCTHKKYVVPGKPEESLLWLKVDANAVHGCGNKMPSGVGSTGVPGDISKLVKDWIAAGAKR